MFPFPGKKKEKQPFPWELKIELRAGQAVAWQGGECFFLGLSPALAGLGPGGRRGGQRGREGGLVRGCECQLT